MDLSLHKIDIQKSEDEILFLNDVVIGLSQTHKKLHSKYFYDEKGDKLFQQIMEMPEYYLTLCELDIFKNKTAELVNYITADQRPFDLIELGAGDALKSAHLLKFMIAAEINFTYMPIDISSNILSVLDRNLKQRIPELKVKLLQGDYFKMLEQAINGSDLKKVILFLGGNIGNMDLEESYNFCREIHSKLNKGDLLITGFDLKKNPHTILNAYNDPQGITASFNLNLLERINRELGADFDSSKFQHYQTYDPVSGACKSYLVSLTEQIVTIGRHNFYFTENELIDMEISQKFELIDIEKLASKSGFEIVGRITDSKNWFVDSIWQAI